jgi:hypothetical protein
VASEPRLRERSLVHADPEQRGQADQVALQGVAAFDVSASIVPAAVRNTRNQEAHHGETGFDAEFLACLKKHGLQFDSKFVFG